MEQDLVCAVCGKVIKDERTIQFSTTGEVVCVNCVHEYTTEEMEEQFGFHVEEEANKQIERTSLGACPF